MTLSLRQGGIDLLYVALGFYQCGSWSIAEVSFGYPAKRFWFTIFGVHYYPERTDRHIVITLLNQEFEYPKFRPVKQENPRGSIR